MKSAATFTIRISIPFWNTKSASIRSLFMPVGGAPRHAGGGYLLERVLATDRNSVKRIVAALLPPATRKDRRQIAKGGGFSAFTTTLLYSRYQKHDLIRSIGDEVAEEYDISFLYRDFREGWSEGVRIFESNLDCTGSPTAVAFIARKDVTAHTPESEEGGDRLNV